MRPFLLAALVMVLLLLYQAWMRDYPPSQLPPPEVSTTTPKNSSESPKNDVKTKSSDAATASTSRDELPETATQQKNPDISISDSESQSQQLLNSQQRIFVETDVFKLEIDTVGGDIRKVYLPKYSTSVEKLDDPFRLMNDNLPNLFIAQSGLLPAESAPTHQAIYSSAQSQYRMENGQNTLDVVLQWKNEGGIIVKKIYSFQRGKYDIKVKHSVENKTEKAWQGQVYAQFQRAHTQEKSGFGFSTYTYTGGAISSPEELYEKITFEDINKDMLKKENRSEWKQGWIAMLQHYFVGAWVPQPDQEYHYYSKILTQGSRYVLGFFGPMQVVEPNTQHSFDMTLFIGPKLPKELEEVASGLELTVDYGWLWFIAQPLFWLLGMIHTLVGNWGWAIIILTILIKLAFFHLSATSYKSMANMRRLQPKLFAMKERYGNDKTRMNQAMMDLYRKEKVNPLGGCLPILVQIPVFIALYWVLLESVALRQAPFMFWIKDLSVADPYFVLPLVMGATMLLQHHLSPTPLDPMQQKIMMAMPIVFTFFFAFFPAGLVLYWTVNNTLSIAQQWVITRQVEGKPLTFFKKSGE